MCLFAALLCVIGLTYYSVATAPETLVSEETTDMFSPPLSQESVVVFDKPMKVRVLQKGLPLSLSVKWRYEVVTKEQ